MCICDEGYSGTGFACSGTSNGIIVLAPCVQVLVFNPSLDVNECEQNNGGCEDLCTNTDGSFYCSCPNRIGFELAPSGLNCTGK